MRLNVERPSSVHVTKLNVLSFLTPVQMVCIQTHITANLWKKWVQAKCLEMYLNSKHHFYSVHEVHSEEFLFANKYLNKFEGSIGAGCTFNPF